MKFDITRQLGFNLHQVALHFRRRLVRTFREYGITVEQWQILNALWRHDGLSARELQKFTMQDLPATLRSLQRLAEKACVQKETLPHDRRVQLWQLTPEGKKLETVLPPLLVKSFNSWLKDFDTCELDRLNQTLQQLRGYLEGEEQ